MSGSIFSLSQGLAYGLISTHIQREENSVKAGENDYLTAICQITQGLKALDFAGKVLNATGQKPFSWAGYSVVYLTSSLLSFLKSKNLVPENFHPALRFCRNHLSSFYQLTSIVSAIALLFFGQTIFACSSLFILSIGIMDQNGWLSLPYRHFLHQYSSPLLIATGLVTGGTFDRIFILLTMISWCANIHLSRQTFYDKKTRPQGNLTLQNMRDFFKGQLKVKINPKYIHYQSIPQVPNIDIQILVNLFDQIDWKNHLIPLRKKLKHDVRFIERHKNPDLKTDQEIIDITKHSLQTFISQVKERKILQGEPADYEKLHTYLKIITQYIENQNDEITKTDILLRLAVEGGEYCGPGKFEVAESVYADIRYQKTDTKDKDALTDKIYYCLQDERKLWMENFYSKICIQSATLSWLGNIIDWHDIHNYNFFMNLYGNEFGLMKAAADNDETAIIGSLTKGIVSLTLGKSIQKAFWNDHTLYHHEKTLIDSIGTAKLPKPEVYDFWKNWIEKQEITDTEKDNLIEELEEARLLDQPIEENGKMNPDFIDLILLDMGILEIIKEENNLPSSL